MRFRSTHDYTVTVPEANATVGPFGELDWPGYDAEVHGPLAGFEALEDEKPARKRKPASDSGKSDNEGDQTTAGSDGGQAPDDTASTTAPAANDNTPAPDAAASEEHKS